MARSDFIQFRVTGDEKATIEANAAEVGLKASEFLRRLGLGMVAVESLPEDDALASPRAPGEPELPPPGPFIGDMKGPVDFDWGEGAEPVQRYRCPNDCESAFRPLSGRARCPACSRTVVPV